MQPIPKPVATASHVDWPILPRRCALSSSISGLSHDLRKQVDVVMTRAPRDGSLKFALMQYLVTDQPLVEIAREHAVTIPRVMYWAAKLRLSGRKRGRRALLGPTPEQKQLIQLFRVYGAAEAARRSAKSRQRIYQVVERWAPELMTLRRLRNAGHVPWTERRGRRRNVIGFRITDDEMQRLLATVPLPGDTSLSANARARAVVLNYISSPHYAGREPGRIPPYRPEKPNAITGSGLNRD